MLDLEEVETAKSNSFWLSDAGDVTSSSSVAIVGLKLLTVSPVSASGHSSSRQAVVLEQKSESSANCQVHVGDRVMLSIEKSAISRFVTHTNKIDQIIKSNFISSSQSTLVPGASKRSADIEDLFAGNTQVYISASPDSSNAIKHTQLTSTSTSNVYYACEPRVLLGTISKIDGRHITIETNESVKRLIQ
jgi:hypothetical protein